MKKIKLSVNKEIQEAASTLGRRGGLANNKHKDKTEKETLFKYAKILGSLGGLKGGPARSLILSARRKKQIAIYGSFCSKLKRGKKLTEKEQEKFDILQNLFNKNKK